MVITVEFDFRVVGIEKGKRKLREYMLKGVHQVEIERVGEDCLKPAFKVKRYDKEDVSLVSHGGKLYGLSPIAKEDVADRLLRSAKGYSCAGCCSIANEARFIQASKDLGICPCF
jgi:hypothetical protein